MLLDGLGLGSVELILPVEDGDVPGCDAEAVDVSKGERFAAVPVPEALLATGEDGGVQVSSFDGIDVDGAEVAAFLTEDGVGGHDRDFWNEPPWSPQMGTGP